MFAMASCHMMPGGSLAWNPNEVQTKPALTGAPAHLPEHRIPDIPYLETEG